MATRGASEGEGLAAQERHRVSGPRHGWSGGLQRTRRAQSPQDPGEKGGDRWFGLPFGTFLSWRWSPADSPTPALAEKGRAPTNRKDRREGTERPSAVHPPPLGRADLRKPSMGCAARGRTGGP